MMACTQKVSNPALCAVLFFFLSLTVAKCFIYFASLSKILFTDQAGCFFLEFHLLLDSPPAFAAVPPLPTLYVLHLSLISDPFFMHYSITLNFHLQCITPSQTHFLPPFGPFLLHFFHFLHPFIIPLFSPPVTSHPTQHFSSL